MKSNLVKIAFADQEQRRNGLLSILRMNNIPFTLHHNKVGEHWVENIIVSILKGNQRLVIGAHYDSLEGSTGANDNAAAVCILVEVAKRLTEKAPQIPIDIVFFDREEYIDRGSADYIHFMNKDNILAMINLDVCGVGNQIVFGPSKNLKDGLLADIFTKVDIQQKHRAKAVEYIPPGDEKSFESKGIPNISIAMLPNNEVDIVVKLAECMYKNQRPQPDEFPHLPSILETMHNGPRDSIEVVEDEAMEKILHYLLDAIYSYE